MNADPLAAQLVLDEALEAAGRPHPSRSRGWIVRRALAMADIGGLLVAFLLAEGLIGEGLSLKDLLLFAATLPGWVVIAKLYRLYDADEERNGHSTADEFVGVFHFVTVGAWLLFAGLFGGRKTSAPAQQVAAR